MKLLSFKINNGQADDSEQPSLKTCLSLTHTHDSSVATPIRWLHSCLQRIVNSPSVHRLRMQYNQSRRALSLLSLMEDKDKKHAWNHIKTKEYSAMWNLTADGKAICMIEGTMKTPLFQCLSIINESDLHKNWLPFVSESTKIHQLSLFTQVLRQKTKFPWPLQDRETVLVGCAVDGLRLSPPCVIMNGESVPESAVSILGYPLLPPHGDLTRMRIHFFTFQLTPSLSDPQYTLAKFIVLLDPQISLVPKSVQSFIARQSATSVYQQEITSAGFKENEIDTRNPEERQFYERLRKLPEFTTDPNYKSLAEQLQENEQMQYPEATDDPYPYAPSRVTVEDVEFFEQLEREELRKKKLRTLHEELEIHGFRAETKQFHAIPVDKDPCVEEEQMVQSPRARIVPFNRPAVHISVKRHDDLHLIDKNASPNRCTVASCEAAHSNSLVLLHDYDDDDDENNDDGDI